MTQLKNQDTLDVSKREKHMANRRKKSLQIFFFVVVALTVCWWIWIEFFQQYSITTKNAYTAVEVSYVTPLINGPVQQVNVLDTQEVKVGDILVKLDDSDAYIALSKAKAALTSAKQKVKQYFENDKMLAASLLARKANVNSEKASVERAIANKEQAIFDLNRRRVLAEQKVIHEEELNHTEIELRKATSDVAFAKANLASAQAQEVEANSLRASNALLFAGLTVDDHPEVLIAQATVEKAQLDLDRTIIRASSTGVISQRSVDVGQQVAVGQRLMIIVPLDKVYIKANFKETQLRAVKVGQPATITSDLYGEDVVYHGKITGFSGGSGSVFAAIPAQNATGNWIKVVQRLPVRIELDSEELKNNPLRVGLSMHVTVDLGVTE